MFPSDQQGQTTFLINLVSNLFKIYISRSCYYQLAYCSSLYCQGPLLLYFPMIKLQKKNSKTIPKTPTKIKQSWKSKSSAGRINQFTHWSFTNFKLVATKVRFDEKQTASALSKEMQINIEVFCYVFKTKETKHEPIT